jgi:hypothetical protein
MRIHSHQDGDGRAQSSNLRQRQVDKDHSALYHMHAQIGVNAGQNQAGQKGRQQEWQNFHGSPLLRRLKGLGQQSNIVVE